MFDSNKFYRGRRLLPHSWSATFLRVSLRTLGACLVLFCVASLAAIVSYNPEDPSFNVATDSSPKNFMGLGGAYLSALLRTSLGWVSPLSFILLLSWSLLIMLGYAGKRIWLRFAALLVVPLVLATIVTLTMQFFEFSSDSVVKATGWIGTDFSLVIVRFVLWFVASNNFFATIPWIGVLLLGGIYLTLIYAFISLMLVSLATSRDSYIEFRDKILLIAFNLSKRFMFYCWTVIFAFFLGLYRALAGGAGAVSSAIKERRLLAMQGSDSDPVIDKQPVRDIPSMFREGQKTIPSHSNLPPVSNPSAVKNPNAGRVTETYLPDDEDEDMFEDGVDAVDNFDNYQEEDAVDPFAQDVDPTLFSSQAEQEDIADIEDIEDNIVPEYKESFEGVKKPENYMLPAVDLLSDIEGNGKDEAQIDSNLLREKGEELLHVLQEFKVYGEIKTIRPGPVVTLFEFEPRAGTKISRIVSLCEDIARSMSATTVRIATQPGSNLIGVELPNDVRKTVGLKKLILSKAFDMSSAQLPIILGRDIGGKPVVADLARMPHLLVAGTTGSGKSVCMNTLILSLLYRKTPKECRLILIDPKMLELSIYNDIPHLMTPVVTDSSQAVMALRWAVKEMEERYRLMSNIGVRNIEGYNRKIKSAKDGGSKLSRRVQTGIDKETRRPLYETVELEGEEMPFIVVVVDEMADLMTTRGKDIESQVQRLAQMARAAGIHLIMATQRPSVDVITGTIKANFPTRISFQVTSKIDSRTILGDMGAEALLGKGDMLFQTAGQRMIRVHGPFCSEDEVELVCNHWKSQGLPEYLSEITEEEGDSVKSSMKAEVISGSSGEDEDDMYQDAIDVIMSEGRVSTSLIQRHLSIGYNRAARIVDSMEKEGLVSAPDRSGRRELLRKS